jgi:hypothetical protein
MLRFNDSKFNDDEINNHSNKNVYEINHIIEIREIFNLCIKDMYILNTEYGIAYKPSLTKLINRIDIEISELNYINKNYNTNFYNECVRRNMSEEFNHLSKFCILEINMILKSYPDEHIIQLWTSPLKY